jgi:glutathione peroxidase
MSFHDFRLHSLEGEEVSLSSYEGKLAVVVNVASKCGYTYQYESLENLYEAYRRKGVVVLGFPCNQFQGQEPGSSEDIRNFCSINFGVTFPLFEKIDVRGETAHPLYRWLISQAPFEGYDTSTPGGAKLLNKFSKAPYAGYLEDNEIKWNFTKFVIGRTGKVLKRFETPVEPDVIARYLDTLLPAR